MIVRRASRTTFLIVFAFSVVSVVRGATITSFRDAFQPWTPAPGWSYLWNSSGPIGNPANYSALVPFSDALYTSDGSPTRPAPPPASFVSIGYHGTFPGGHPGMGLTQSGSGGIERYCIAAYTLPNADTVAVLNGLIELVNPNFGGSSDGVNVEVFVNSDPTPKATALVPPGLGSTASFSAALGSLNAGDTIYVAVGSNNEDTRDGFQLQYDIASVPEPQSIAFALIALGSWTILRKKRS